MESGFNISKWLKDNIVLSENGTVCRDDIARKLNYEFSPTFIARSMKRVFKGLTIKHMRCKPNWVKFMSVYIGVAWKTEVPCPSCAGQQPEADNTAEADAEEITEFSNKKYQESVEIRSDGNVKGQTSDDHAYVHMTYSCGHIIVPESSTAFATTPVIIESSSISATTSDDAGHRSISVQTLSNSESRSIGVQTVVKAKSRSVSVQTQGCADISSSSVQTLGNAESSSFRVQTQGNAENSHILIATPLNNVKSSSFRAQTPVIAASRSVTATSGVHVRKISKRDHPYSRSDPTQNLPPFITVVGVDE